MSVQNGTVASTDADVAASYANQFSGENAYTRKEEVRLRWKLDLRLVPLLWFNVTLGAMDKVTTATAALYGFRQDTDLTGMYCSWLGRHRIGGQSIPDTEPHLCNQWFSFAIGRSTLSDQAAANSLQVIDIHGWEVHFTSATWYGVYPVAACYSGSQLRSSCLWCNCYGAVSSSVPASRTTFLP